MCVCGGGEDKEQMAGPEGGATRVGFFLGNSCLMQVCSCVRDWLLEDVLG